jgi:hypothetical protein
MKRNLSLFILSFFSFYFTHTITYSLYYNNNSERNIFLLATGHGYLSILAYLIIPLLFLFLVTRYFSLIKSNKNLSFISILSTQFLLFITVEHLERFLTGHNPLLSFRFYVLALLAHLPISSLIYLITRFIIDPFIKFLLKIIYIINFEIKYNNNFIYNLYYNNFLKFSTAPRSPPYL